MFRIILLSVAALMTAYVAWRMGSIAWVRRFVSPLCLLGGGGLIWGLVALSFTYARHGADMASEAAGLAGMNLLGVIFLGFVLFLAVDLATGFGRFVPAYAEHLRTGALACCVLFSGLAMVQGQRAPVITDYELASPNLPRALDGLVIVAASDMHVGSHLGAGWLSARVAQIEALKPDLVVLLGDTIDGRFSRDELLPVLRSLRAPLGVYAVEGNHERYGRRAGLELLAEAGIEVLVNRWQEPAPGLLLAGVEDLTVHAHSGSNHDPMTEALAGRPRGLSVLLSHSPLRGEDAAASGVGLMLSGHTHNGQIWPFGYFVRLNYPLLEGRYALGNMTAIVSRGAGTWGPRMRLWKPGEIVRITLRSAA